MLGLLVMSLWNALLPAILGVKAIGFWQALGILVLSRILVWRLRFPPGDVWRAPPDAPALDEHDA